MLHFKKTSIAHNFLQRILRAATLSSAHAAKRRHNYGEIRSLVTEM
jgi:hypothetical protein